MNSRLPRESLSHYIFEEVTTNGKNRVEARADILRIHSRSMNLTRGINLTKIAEKMNGCSGAELKGVCTEAGMYALRERRVHVTQEDFDLATAKVLNKHDDKEVSLGKLWK